MTGTLQKPSSKEQGHQTEFSVHSLRYYAISHSGTIMSPDELEDIYYNTSKFPLFAMLSLISFESFIISNCVNVIIAVRYLQLHLTLVSFPYEDKSNFSTPEFIQILVEMLFLSMDDR